MKNPIKMIICYKVPIILNSPLNVSGGNEENTDRDILVDFYGNPFIPGSSIAGSMRKWSLSESKYGRELVDNLFGNNDNTNSKMSSVYFSDLKITDYKICQRDEIKVDENKITEKTAKYNFEIIETGAKGLLKIKLILRELDFNNTKYIDNCLKLIKEAFDALNSNDIVFGFKKSRGFGRFCVENQKYEISAFKDNIKIDNIEIDNIGINPISKYIDFDWNDNEIVWKTNICEKYISSEYIKIVIPLKLIGGISIREYSSKINEADYQHICCNEKAVIPATSWNGAIRHRAISILKEVLKESSSIEKAENELNNVWGTNEDKYKASSVIFEESIIEGSEPLIITRNKINRFDASTVNGSLYTEISQFEGTTKLVVKIKNEENNFWLVGLLNLVFKDLYNGLLSVGGQTTIGRGIFKLNGNVEFVKDNIDYLKYLKERSVNVWKKN